MPISVSCDCGRSYQIASKNAGKKFRCKECGEMVRVPRASAARRKQPAPKREHFEEFADEEIEDYEDYGTEDEYVAAPHASRKWNSPRKTGRRSNRSGMPIPVMVAILCEGGMIALNCYYIAGIVGVVLNAPSANFSLVGAVALIGVVRIVIEFALLRGFLRGDSLARWLACGLSTMGLLLFCIVFSISAYQAKSESQQSKYVPFWDRPTAGPRLRQGTPIQGNPADPGNPPRPSETSPSRHFSPQPEFSVQKKRSPASVAMTYSGTILAVYLTQIIVLLLPASGRHFDS